uniref:Uncharacterized protein n=1 Tax=Arundo donax TaxID=35708 RepID=A0A0A8Y0E8_ARUDO
MASFTWSLLARHEIMVFHETMSLTFMPLNTK